MMINWIKLLETCYRNKRLKYFFFEIIPKRIKLIYIKINIY